MTRSTWSRRAARSSIDGGAGDNTFNLSPTAQNLSNLAGTIVVSGTGGTNHVVLNDQNGAGGSYTVDDFDCLRSRIWWSHLWDHRRPDPEQLERRKHNQRQWYFGGHHAEHGHRRRHDQCLRHRRQHARYPRPGRADIGHSRAAPGSVGMQNLFGTINVDNALGFTDLTLDDSADTTGQTARSFNDGTNGQVTGLSPATINYVNDDTSSLTVFGGSAATRSRSTARSPTPSSRP